MCVSLLTRLTTPNPKHPPPCLQKETLKVKTSAKQSLSIYDNLSGPSQVSFNWRSIVLTFKQENRRRGSFFFLGLWCVSVKPITYRLIGNTSALTGNQGTAWSIHHIPTAAQRTGVHVSERRARFGLHDGCTLQKLGAFITSPHW